MYKIAVFRDADSLHNGRLHDEPELVSHHNEGNIVKDLGIVFGSWFVSVKPIPV